MKKSVLFVLATMVMPLFAEAQQSVLEMSMKDAVEYAVEHNRNLQVSQKNIDLYQEKVREALAQGLPQVDARLTYSTNFGYEMSLMGQNMKVKDNMILSGSLSQLLFSGEWIVALRSSKIAAHLSEQQVQITELDMKQEIMLSYYSILVSERTRDIYTQNIKNMQEILKHTENMYEAGVVEVTDVDQIRINMSQLNNALLSVQRTVELNYNLFRIQLGLPVGSPIVLTEKLEQLLNESEILKVASQSFDINKNAEYQLLQTQKRIYEESVSLKRWAFAPTLSASYSYTRYIQAGSEFAEAMNAPHALSVTLNVPLFSGFSKRAQLNEAKIELEQNNLTLAQTEDQLNTNDVQCRFNLNNALENYNLQLANVDVAARIFQNYRYKYEQGAASSMDLTQSNSNYLQAESDFTNSCLTLLQAKLTLERLYNQFQY